MTTQVLSLPIFRAFDSAGLPLAGGLLYTYAAGTTTPLATYSSSDTSTPNANPVVLDSSGTAVVRTTTAAYKFVLKDATGTNTLWSVDNWQGNYLSQSDIISLLGADPIQRQTAAEIAAGVTPTNYGYPPGNVMRYGASNAGNSSIDDTAAIQAAVNVAKYTNVGAVASVYIPAGQGCYTTAPIVVYDSSTWGAQNSPVHFYGDGPSKSFIITKHNGDAIQYNGASNSGTNAYSEFNDFGILTANTSTTTGAGIMLNGGSFHTIRNVQVSNMAYGIILDQAEIVSVRDCIFNASTYSKAGMWLVNGADRKVGNLAGFTNRITIESCAFEGNGANGIGLIDDGGSNHNVANNNFQSYTIGARYCYVAALSHLNNEHESASVADIELLESTWGGGLIASAYFGPSYGFSIRDNVLISPGSSTANILIGSAINGDIVGNVFGQATAQAIGFSGGNSNISSGIVIEGNDKVVTGTAKTATPFFQTNASAGAVLKANQIRQVPVTYAAVGVSAGSSTVTPASMEGIRVGSRLICRNSDATGTNGEQVIVTATTATTFTATFANPKSSNFTIRGGTPIYQIDGSGAFSAATTATVTFATAEYDSNYKVTVTATSAPGGYLWVTSKGTTGFTVNCSASNSATFDWQITRD